MERKPRKKNNRFTIMVIPHYESAIKSLKIPITVIYGLALFGMFSILIFSYFGFSYLKLEITQMENSELKIINNTQAKEIIELQETTKDTLKKFDEILETDSRVRELVGLKEKNEDKQPSRSQPQGGPATSTRNINTLAFTDIDTIDNDILAEKESRFDYKIDPSPGLDTIEVIKDDLHTINNLIVEQKDVLDELEKDVKARLNYLAAIPNGWPVRGKITSDFGWRKNPFTHKTWEYHEGIDIKASYGTPVRAAGAGTVIFIGWKTAYGYTVVIKHGYGYTSQYAHNSKITVKVGQKVERGDIIARAGSTGRSTGTHVDFRILYNGKWIDPLKVLK